MSDPLPETDPKLQAADAFFGAALHRIRHISIVLALAGSLLVWAKFGTAIGLGFVIGCVVSYVNFVWLERVINEVANRVTQTGDAAPGRGIVVRFLLRYGFIAIACFAILISFKSSVYGLLGGLFLSVAAILCEAAYELTVALRRDI
jgi:ATP synthase I chain